MEDVIVEVRIVLASPLAVRRKSQLQKFGLHGLSVNHDVNPVHRSAVVVMHLGVLFCHSDEGIPQHLFDLLVDACPADTVILLEIFDEFFVLYLLEIGNLSVVHDCELRFVGSQMPSISGIVVVS
jgi:hypothetical protein